MTGYGPTPPRRDPEAPSARAAPVPVVVLHGALRGRVGLLPTAWGLRRRGLRARTFGYATRRDALDAHAQALSQFLDKWLAGERPPVLGFLTHSMGGLVVRAYLATAGDLHSDLQRVVMLSPPNQGSQLAQRNAENPAFRWLYGRAARELQPGRVAQLPALPGTARALILAGGRGESSGYNPKISGDNDGVVSVAEMQLPGAASEHVGGLHSMLQWRTDVLERAAAFLRGG